MAPRPEKDDDGYMQRSTKWYLAGVGAIILTAVLAVTLAPTPPQLDPTTPEGVVQTYVQAVMTDDATSAEAALTAKAARLCTDFPVRTNRIQRVRIADSAVNGDRAVVDVRITWEPADAFSSEWSEDGSFRLVERDGLWKIDEAPWSLCRGW